MLRIQAFFAYFYMFNLNVIKSNLNGTRFRINQSYPGNSGSYDSYSILSWKYLMVRSIFSPILEIVDRTIHIQSLPGNSGSYDPYSVLSWKYWIIRSILSPILEIVDRTIHISARVSLRMTREPPTNLHGSVKSGDVLGSNHILNVSQQSGEFRIYGLLIQDPNIDTYLGM